jgi:hypothetical protein
MTPFFIPVEQGQAGEDVYQQLRRQTEREMGRAPSQRRILEVWTRRGKLDCRTRVGDPDPIWGDTVTAIFDMGSHQPFVVFRQHPGNPQQYSCEVLGCNAYAILDFTP